MTIYLPVVPSKIDSFDPLPIVNIDDTISPFGPQILNKENLLKIYYNISPLNSENDYTHITIRFLSIAANKNPLLDKNYPLGVYITPKESDSNGTYFKIPAHSFIKVGGTISIDQYRIPSKGTASGANYANLEYTDLVDLSTNGIGLNEYYRAQIKLMNFGAAVPRTTSSVSNGSPGFATSYYESFSAKFSTIYTAGTQQLVISSATSTVSAGAAISGFGIYPNTYILGATASAITISRGLSEDVPSQSPIYITYNQASYSASSTKIITNTIINPTSPASNISEWSSQILLKPLVIADLESDSQIGIPTFQSRNTTSGALITTNQATAQFYNFQFNYPSTVDEKVQSYRFQIFEDSDLETAYEDSGTIEVQQYLAQSSIFYTNEKELDNAATYYLSVNFKTTTGFSYTKRYQFSPIYSIYPLGVTFDARSDRENGRVEFQIIGRQVRFIPNNNVYDDTSFQFINSDNSISYSSSTQAFRQNALQVTDSTLMKNKQQLIFNPDFNSWSIQMIVGGIRPKTDGPLNTANMESNFIFKLVDDENDPSYQYYIVPVSYSESVPTYIGVGTASITTSYLTRSYNEFNIVKKVANSSAALKTFNNINNLDFSRSLTTTSKTEIITTYTSYMNESNMTLGSYDSIDAFGTSTGALYSSYSAINTVSATAITGSTIIFTNQTASISLFQPLRTTGTIKFATASIVQFIGSNYIVSSKPIISQIDLDSTIIIGDDTNKYYLFFGETNGKMFLYAKHLNPNGTETQIIDRLNR